MADKHPSPTIAALAAAKQNLLSAEIAYLSAKQARAAELSSDPSAVLEFLGESSRHTEGSSDERCNGCRCPGKRRSQHSGKDGEARDLEQPSEERKDASVRSGGQQGVSVDAVGGAGVDGAAAMRRAIELSQVKMEENCGGPFGCVIVKDGKIIAEGWNQVTSAKDPTAHAEMVAIRNACAALQSFNLEGCTVYTSCEPCPMCLAGLYWARVDMVYFGNTRKDAAEIGFDDDFIYSQFGLTQEERTLKTEVLLREEAQVVFQNWTKKADKTEY